MKRTLLVLAVPVALLVLLPPASAQEESVGGFHGFDSFQTNAQGQVAELTGFLNAFREDNRLVGAVSEINGPPANSRNIAAFIQRGEGATFVYGVIGGQGGGRGTLPDPPPGEANAYYPTDPPEMTFAGPVTSGTGGSQAVDGRFHAKASETPTGRAEATITKLSQEGAFTVEAATVVSHTEPVEGGGVQAESVSVLHKVAAGPLLIETLVSRAYAMVPPTGEPKGIATTVVEGATVNGTPVQITAAGVIVGENANPLGQDQVNQALADAGFEQVRLLPATTTPSEQGQNILADAGAIEFVKQDQAFGASNPQGFAGGGFSIGGASAGISSVRCAPDCPEGIGLPEDPIIEDTPSLEETPSLESSDTSTASAEMTVPIDESYAVDTSGGVSFDTGNFSTGGGISLPEGPSLDYNSTTSVTPPGLSSSSGGGSVEQAASAPVVSQQTTLASSGMGPEEAHWVRDLYLGAGVAAGVLFVGSRLAQAFN